MNKIKRFDWGFRKDFMLSWDKVYWNGEFWNINLGWVWIVYSKYGLPI